MLQPHYWFSIFPFLNCQVVNLLQATNSAFTWWSAQLFRVFIGQQLCCQMKWQPSWSSREVHDHSGSVSWVSSFLTLPVSFHLLLGLQLLCSTTLPCLGLAGKGCSLWQTWYSQQWHHPSSRDKMTHYTICTIHDTHFNKVTAINLGSTVVQQ